MKHLFIPLLLLCGCAPSHQQMLQRYDKWYGLQWCTNSACRNLQADYCYKQSMLDLIAFKTNLTVEQCRVIANMALTNDNRIIK